jgi:hypothetical protein
MVAGQAQLPSDKLELRRDQPLSRPNSYHPNFHGY